MGEKIVTVALAIVSLATVSVLVGSGNTAKIFTSAGGAFSDSVRAAMGK